MSIVGNEIKGKEPKSDYIRVNLTLPDDLDRVLQEIGNDARAGGGYKIPKTMIMRALIRLLMQLNVDPGGVKTEEEFLERILEAIKKQK